MLNFKTKYEANLLVVFFSVQMCNGISWRTVSIIIFSCSFVRSFSCELRWCCKWQDQGALLDFPWDNLLHIYLVHPCDISTLIIIAVAFLCFLAHISSSFLFACLFFLSFSFACRKLYSFIVLFSSTCTVYILWLFFRSFFYSRNSGVLLSIYHCHYIYTYISSFLPIHTHISTYLFSCERKSKLIYA